MSHVNRAYDLIAGVAHRTPVLRSANLDAIAGGALYLKMESFQKSGAFKFRGAFTALVRRLDKVREQGVVTASSGNHGGALAVAARILGVRAVVVMPEDAVGVKVEAIRDAGAEVVFRGLSSRERQELAGELAEEQGLVYVPPYDHADIIAGQGTVALEAVDQVPDATVFLAPCGGGGLLAGCAAYLSSARPGMELWGVEPEAGNDTWLSIKEGRRVTIELPETIADGARNVSPGRLTFPLIRRHCRGIVLVSEEEIQRAVALLLTRTKTLAEPTGALAAAAALARKVDLEGRTAVAVVSGGNADPAVLAQCCSA